MYRATRIVLMALTAVALMGGAAACKKKAQPETPVETVTEPTVPAPKLGSNPSVDQCRDLSEKAFDSSGALRSDQNPDEVKNCCSKVMDSLSPSERSQWSQFDRCKAYMGS